MTNYVIRTCNEKYKRNAKIRKYKMEWLNDSGSAPCTTGPPPLNSPKDACGLEDKSSAAPPPDAIITRCSQVFASPKDSPPSKGYVVTDTGSPRAASPLMHTSGKTTLLCTEQDSNWEENLCEGTMKLTGRRCAEMLKQESLIPSQPIYTFGNLC